MVKKNFEKDINVPSKRLDRIDKMEIDLASYEQMELDIEKIIEPYQLNWELDCLSLPTAIQSILERKEQECEFSNLRIIQLQETLSQYETDLSTKDCIVETCKAQYKELKAENEELKGLNTRLDNQRETYWKGYQKLKATLTEIKFWARELLKRTGQVVPYEIKQILQKISECEVE